MGYAEPIRSRTARPFGRGRFPLVCGALAFLIQMVALPLLMAAAPGVAAGAAVPICTASGIVFVTLDSAGKAAGEAAPLKDGGSPKAQAGCPLCPLASGLAPPPSHALLPTPALVARHGPVALPGLRVAAAWFLSVLQARGPPASLAA